MTSRTAWALTCAATLLLAGATALAEEPARILVLPVDVEGDELASFAMTEALEQAARDSGREPTLSGETPDNIAAIAGCPGALSECMEAVGEALAVDEVLYAEATAVAPGSYRVRIVHLVRGRPFAERAVEFAAALPEEAGVRLSPEVGRLLAGQRAEPDTELEPALTPAGPAAASVEPSADRFSIARVGAAPWVVAGSGVALLGVGAALGLAGEAKQSDIDDAPVDSAEDLEALRDLEQDADALTGAGNALLLFGGLAVAAGVGWAVYRATRAPDGEPATTVALVPVAAPDGVGVALSVVGW